MAPFESLDITCPAQVLLQVMERGKFMGMTIDGPHGRQAGVAPRDAAPLFASTPWSMGFG